MAAENEDRGLADLLKENGYNDVGASGANFELLGTLSAAAKRRLAALKKLQLGSIEVECEFYKRVHLLEKEFEAKFSEFNEKRRKIISGEYEPTDAEADFPIVHSITEEEKQALAAKEPADDKPGLSHFWAHVLKATDAIGDMIQEHDEPILEHLTDISSTIELEPPGFTLYFHFSPNEYFSNSVLKKQYLLDMTPEEDDPFDYDGPSVAKAIGDSINWTEGKNVTQKVIKKKQKKGGNANKFITKTVRAESFFNFFNPPELPNKDEMNEEQEEEINELNEVLRSDYEIGQILRDQIVPRAVLFYTGEANDNDLFDDDFEDEDDEGDASSGDDDEE